MSHGSGWLARQRPRETWTACPSVASGLAKRRLSVMVVWNRWVSWDTTPTVSARVMKLRSGPYPIL